MLSFSCKFPMDSGSLAIMEDRLKRYRAKGHRVSGRVKGGRFTLLVTA